MVSPSIGASTTANGPSGNGVELADVVRRFSAEYLSRYGSGMMPSQEKALRDIAGCCTEEMGGRLHYCDDCQETFWSFHCCRNRSCPKCHGSQTREWLRKRQAELLPCDYFHAVATVPSELHRMFRREQKYMYGLLMKVSAGAVKELCAKKRHLGALPGILAVLHTWTGDLRFHPHVHLLITGGGIAPDGEHFEPARGKFLVPVAVLSRKIAAKFREALEKEKPSLYARIPKRAWRREWVSFCKHFGQGNDAVLNYLSRYVFRMAISNARILGVDDTHVAFRCKNQKTRTWRTIRLPGVEFLRRFFQHVLPRGFHKVRYFGLWHPSKRDLSSRAWLLLILEKPTEAVRPGKIAELVEGLSQLVEFPDHKPIDDEEPDSYRPRCPHCGSKRTRVIAERPRYGVP